MNEGYRFVKLPAKVHRVEREYARHDRRVPDSISVRLDLTYEAEQPVHIGSGFKGLDGNVVVRCGAMVRGVPGVPGSSMKGVLRSRYEAITRSCTGHTLKNSRSLRSSTGITKGFFTKDVLSHDAFVPCTRELMCAACALFGLMSKRSRITVLDFEGDKAFVLEAMLEQFSPNDHHLGRCEIEDDGREKKFKISELRGRKFGMGHGPIPEKKQWQLVETIPKGTLLRGSVLLRNILREELGGLLVALGRHPASALKIGSGKGNLRKNAADFDASFGRIKLVELTWRDHAGKPLTEDARAAYEAFTKSADRWAEGENQLVALHQGAC
ncbi:MAG: hypothetical protein IPM54_38400 [Polyangiaceae bacterium]|nr:hypothetical protein [Polyangiaceae bacterium]